MNRHAIKKPTYSVRKNATLKNRLNNELFFGDVINEESIDGKTFFVVRKEGKVFKLNKDSFVVQNR
jgi:hypothetical protein